LSAAYLLGLSAASCLAANVEPAGHAQTVLTIRSGAEAVNLSGTDLSTTRFKGEHIRLPATRAAALRPIDYTPSRLHSRGAVRRRPPAVTDQRRGPTSSGRVGIKKNIRAASAPDHVHDQCRDTPGGAAAVCPEPVVTGQRQGGISRHTEMESEVGRNED
jgi:hypothetical protein